MDLVCKEQERKNRDSWEKQKNGDLNIESQQVGRNG